MLTSSVQSFIKSKHKKLLKRRSIQINFVFTLLIKVCTGTAKIGQNKITLSIFKISVNIAVLNVWREIKHIPGVVPVIDCFLLSPEFFLLFNSTTLSPGLLELETLADFVFCVDSFASFNSLVLEDVTKWEAEELRLSALKNKEKKVFFCIKIIEKQRTQILYLEK